MQKFLVANIWNSRPKEFYTEAALTLDSIKQRCSNAAQFLDFRLPSILIKSFLSSEATLLSYDPKVCYIKSSLTTKLVYRPNI